MQARLAHLVSIVLIAFFATACSGSGTEPDDDDDEGVNPPAGASNWVFSYKTATSHTCPGTPATPTDGGPVLMAVAPDGKTLSLVGTTGTTISIPLVTRDASGNWVRQEDASFIAPGAFIRITYRFSTSRLAQGEMFASRTILADLSGNTCSATWPITLDRQ
jgi:hypothetical protein